MIFSLVIHSFVWRGMVQPVAFSTEFLKLPRPAWHFGVLAPVQHLISLYCVKLI